MEKKREKERSKIPTYKPMYKSHEALYFLPTQVRWVDKQLPTADKLMEKSSLFKNINKPSFDASMNVRGTRETISIKGLTNGGS